MKIKMSGPIGSFELNCKCPSLLVAGGIGITPFRSILKEITAAGHEKGQTIHLIYMDSKKSFLYKDELDAIANQTTIQVSYLDSRDDLEQEIDKFINLYKDNGNYFIAGSKSIVKSISSYIQQKNIPKGNIKKDAFFGY